MSTQTVPHASLGLIQGKLINSDLLRFHSLPYASIPRRFARSTLLTTLPDHDPSSTEPYDAGTSGPCSVQLKGSAHMDAEANQLPTDNVEEQEQSEDCLRLTITVPRAIDDAQHGKLPVLVFIHGGAFFLGSGERAWLDPTRFCQHAIELGSPIVFVSVNYRLGLLGFLHSPEAGDLMPPNNALHDQIRAFEWVQANIEGFGGNAGKITAMGQSAGGESLSLHALSGREERLFRRAITLSGGLVTMPAKTPGAYQEMFLECAAKMGIETTGRGSREIAERMGTADLEDVRKANFVGAPCTESKVLPYEKPTMALMRGDAEGGKHVDWLESHVVSSSTYDGSISYIMTKQNEKRKEHAGGFVKIAREVLGGERAEELLQIYGLKGDTSDDEALEKMCLFESDVGFVSAAVSQVMGLSETGTTTYFQLFDLGNPFEGMLAKDRFASHTWDIVALLGAYEDRLSKVYVKVIRDWREKVLRYVVDGAPVCAHSQLGRDGRGGTSLLVDDNGVREVRVDETPGAERREKLWELAERVEKDGAAEKSQGLDLLWEGVCRRWLDQGQ